MSVFVPDASSCRVRLSSGWCCVRWLQSPAEVKRAQRDGGEAADRTSLHLFSSPPTSKHLLPATMMLTPQMLRGGGVQMPLNLDGNVYVDGTFDSFTSKRSTACFLRAQTDVLNSRACLFNQGSEAQIQHFIKNVVVLWIILNTAGGGGGGFFMCDSSKSWHFEPHPNKPSDWLTYFLLQWNTWNQPAKHLSHG